MYDKQQTTTIKPYPNPYEDYCDCDERCNKCGKKKKKFIDPGRIWCCH